MKPYYLDDWVTIYHGDCREIDHWRTGDVLVTDPPYGIAFSSGYGGKFLNDRIIGDGDRDLIEFLLRAWGDKPALMFGSPKAVRPTTSRHVLIWEKGDHVGMGDLAFPWRLNYEEIYVFGPGFMGRRSSSVLRHNAPSPNFTPPHLRHHPSEKPLSLMHELIAKCPPGLIADPFMGSGTTLRAAKNLGRVAIGIEIEERYCEVAAKRLQQEILPLEVTA